MKPKLMRLFLISLFSFSIFCSSIAFAKTTVNFDTLSPTLKIISYRHTKNNDVDSYSSGSATIIRKDGLILTNNHVIEKDDDEVYDAFEICLNFTNQDKPVCEYTASYIARNKDLDLALLKIDSKDIRGNTLPSLPFLAYEHDTRVQDGDSITVVGFPSIGGETITQTKGQVSGFEEFDSIPYIKTDTDISSGNSGGTALNSEGYFVGVPTYVISSLENLGYLLDIHAAKDWINENKDLDPDIQSHIQKILSDKLKIRNDAKEKKTYHHPYYPSFTLTIPDDWEFGSLERDSIFIYSEKTSKDYSLSISIKEFPFSLTEEYLEEAYFEQFEKNQEYFQNYNRENIEFQGIDSYLISYVSTWGDLKYFNIIIPYGNVGVIVSYEYMLKEEAEDKEVFDGLLENLTFKDKPKEYSAPKTLTREDPPFSISSAGGWHMQENKNPLSDDLIVEFLRPDNIEGSITLSHYEMSESDKHVTAEEFLDNILRDNEYIRNFRLVSKNDSIFIDGLSGVSLTYNYQGEELNQTRKSSEIYLFDKDHYYHIDYDDLDTNYDVYLPEFKDILMTFKNLNEETKIENGDYELGSLNYVFYDISYHRYEQAISRLKDKGIVEGYANLSFKPEQSVSRAEALKMILISKAVFDEKQGDETLLETIQSYKEDIYKESDFEDTKFLRPFHGYLRYARENEIIHGHEDNTFRPEDSVNIAELTKMLLNVYEIPTWDIPEEEMDLIPWYKPFMDKGFELSILPEGIYNADHIVSRGELAYLIDSLMSLAESGGYYY